MTCIGEYRIKHFNYWRSRTVHVDIGMAVLRGGKYPLYAMDKKNLFRLHSGKAKCIDFYGNWGEGTARVVYEKSRIKIGCTYFPRRLISKALKVMAGLKKAP